ncbi:MAG: alpha/beta fold hydrolase [Ginsengibacter sp.]|jgi:pimeloyl-ACP methyl ester carboxylesterase
MKHIYCISGFGADERVFAKLDFGNNDVHFIQWKIPEKNETLASYAKRMQQEIVFPNPILIGLSFGGMMAIEIAKLIPVEKVILISSIRDRYELPFFMKLTAALRLNRIIPLKPYKILEPIENYNLGVETDGEKQLLREYRKNIKQAYTDFAINEIVNWKNEWSPKNVIHIHGTNDHIFPIKYIHNPDYIINGGGHLLLMNNAEEVNQILKKELAE